MTSSPALTPAASRARCNAVVQFETAQAYGALTRAANSRSNAATSGPCVIHPDRMTRRAASASGSPIHGLAIGIIEISLPGVLRESNRTSGFPPGHETFQSFFQRNAGAESEYLFGFTGIREAPRHGIYFPRGPVTWGYRALHD